MKDYYNADYIEKLVETIQHNKAILNEIIISLDKCNRNFKEINEACKKITAAIENESGK